MNRKKFLEGLRDGLPIALGYLAVSFGIGISCHAAGITALQGFLMSLFNNASAGEYGGITVITENSGVWDDDPHDAHHQRPIHAYELRAQPEAFP